MPTFKNSIRRTVAEALVYKGSAKFYAPGCVNAAGKLRQKWEATAGIKFTKSGWSLDLSRTVYFDLTFVDISKRDGVDVQFRTERS